MKNLIIEFLKKHWQTVLIFLLLALLVIIYSIKQGQNMRFVEKIATLNAEYKTMDKDRNFLAKERDGLIKQQFKSERKIDSINLVLAKKKQELINLQKQHEQEIAQLLAVPDDTVYIRLQVMYPNYDVDLLKYPFSGYQIRKIYNVSLSYPRLQSEFTAQAGLFTSCNDLNEKYKANEINLKSQITNCNKDLSFANTQIENRNNSLDAYIKKDKRSSFWKKTLVIIAGTGWIIAAIK